MRVGVGPDLGVCRRVEADLADDCRDAPPRTCRRDAATRSGRTEASDGSCEPALTEDSELDRCPYVALGELREVRHYLLGRHPCCEVVQDVVDGDPRAHKARLAAPNTGAGLDQLRQIHAERATSGRPLPNVSGRDSVASAPSSCGRRPAGLRWSVRRVPGARPFESGDSPSTAGGGASTVGTEGQGVVGLQASLIIVVREFGVL